MIGGAKSRTALLKSGIILFAIMVLTSCAAKRIEMPNYEGVDVRQVIAERGNIKNIEAIFAIEFEKDDDTMSGDAALDLTDKTLHLRVYSLGFLVGEIREENGIIKSNPELGINKSLILVDGLRSSIMWWKIKGYEMEEQEGLCRLRNSWQDILVDKKTMLPKMQTIEMENGRELKIFYEEPESSEGFWYPSKMRIELSKYVVRLKIKSISLIPHSGRDQQQQPL